MSAIRNSNLIYSIGEKIQGMGMVTETVVTPNGELVLYSQSKDADFFLDIQVNDEQGELLISGGVEHDDEYLQSFDIDAELFEASQFVTGLIRGLVHNE